MRINNNVIDCYNKTANNYADKFIDELQHKHLDRILLKHFAAENTSEKIIDLGCGPGQTTKFLYENGIVNIMGADISEKMIDVAKNLHPQIAFDLADMLNLPYKEKTFGAAIAFYSLIHFNEKELLRAFKEIKRILKDNGQFLFSFHLGNKIVHLDNFLDQQVKIDFHFFEMENIISLLAKNSFEIIDCIQRKPYPNIEYPSDRGYVWVRSI